MRTFPGRGWSRESAPARRPAARSRCRWIDGRIVEPLRLQKDLVAFAVGEADDLVLDRGAIARAAAGDRAGIDRRSMRVGAHDPWVPGSVWVMWQAIWRVGRAPRSAPRTAPAARRRSGLQAPSRSSSVEPRRRAGLQPAEREPARSRLAPARPRRVADPAGGVRISSRCITPRGRCRWPARPAPSSASSGRRRARAAATAPFTERIAARFPFDHRQVRRWRFDPRAHGRAGRAPGRPGREGNPGPRAPFAG